MQAYLASILLLLSPLAEGKVLHGGGGTQGGGTGPANAVAAAVATANSNSLCAAISPFYWEIGNATSILASGSVGGAIGRTQSIALASASKWVFATYVANSKNGSLTATDINFLHQTSGYTNGQDSCSRSPGTIDACLAQINTSNGLPYSYQIAADVGVFHYNSANFLNLAGTTIGGPDGISIGSTKYTLFASTFSPYLGASLTWTSPLLSGGLYTTTAAYVTFLQNILAGTPNGGMNSLLGTSPVCTNPGSTYSGTIPAGCAATYSPIPANDGHGHSEDAHYSIGHWVEDSAPTNGDGAFSSAGSLGFYPWIDSTKTYYGVVVQNTSKGGQGYPSWQCGRLVRRAYLTGIQQTGTIPQ